MSSISVEELISKTDLLPTSANLLIRLKMLLDDMDTTPEQITETVEADPAIAGQVIRMANSVMFAGRGRCSNISEAVTRVGFNEIYRLVGGIIANEVYLTDTGVYDLEPGDLWAYSLRVAAAMRALSSSLPDTESIDSDTAYTIGLMHNIGVVVINNYYLTEGIPGYVEGSEPLNIENEMHYLGFTNPEVAAAVLASWGLPENVFIPVYNQYDPFGDERYIHASSLLNACKYAHEYEMENADDPYTDFEFPEELQPYLSQITPMDLMDAVVERGSELKKIIMTAD